MGWPAAPGEGSFGDLVSQVADYAIIGLDPQGTITSWNLGAERVKQYTAAEAIGKSFAMFYPEEDRRSGLPLSLLRKARAEGRVEHLGWRVRKDGSRFWGDVVITAIHDSEGNLTGFTKVTRDLTEQHELETQLRESEERLRLLVGQVVDYAIIALDPQGIIQTWNLGAERVKGYTADEAIGRSFTMFYPEEDRHSGLPLQLLNQAREQGRVEHLGWRVRKDGTRFWGDVVITALHDEEGELTGYAKVTRDLTEQHALEVALKNSEERLRLLVGQVVDYAIIALDPQGTIETWNLGAERVKGYTADQAIGRSFAMFYTEEDRRSGLPLELLAKARATGRVEHTGWRVRRDGSRFWGDVVITALHDSEGHLTGYAKVTRDRTDLKALEDAQDAFYATFNHDFRTPVTAIKGFVDAIRHAEDDESRSRLIDRVESSADRLLVMVEGLVEFARQRAAHASLTLADIDLAQVARSAVHDLSTHFDPARVRVADAVSLAKGNGVAMHRVVTNLAINALKYSPPDSQVEITFSRGRAGYLRMAISDQGRGIDPRDLETIFDEFTRGRMAEDDGGTGLGLASVRELVHQQEGEVWIESEVGIGTTVTVELPSQATLRPDAPSQRSGADPEPGPAPPSPESGPSSESSSEPAGHCPG
ncbi:MAG: PAS domain-containing sensor histidine kinase [Marmoricola sp.]